MSENERWLRMDWEWGIETLKRELCARIIGIKKKNMFLFDFLWAEGLASAWMVLSPTCMKIVTSIGDRWEAM